MTKTTWRHVAVEEVDIADKSGIEERSLVGGACSAAYEGTSSRRPIFVELFTKSSEWRPRQSRNRATQLSKTLRLSVWRTSKSRCSGFALLANAAIRSTVLRPPFSAAQTSESPNSAAARLWRYQSSRRHRVAGLSDQDDWRVLARQQTICSDIRNRSAIRTGYSPKTATWAGR